MEIFPEFNNVLLSKAEVNRLTPCKLFCEVVLQSFECSLSLGRLFGEYIYHSSPNASLRDEFRRKLTKTIDYMRNRQPPHLLSDHLHILSQEQIQWLKNSYFEWIHNPSAVSMASRDHVKRRYFQCAQEITVLDLIKYDLAEEIHLYAYPPFNFIARVAEGAMFNMSPLEVQRYEKSVQELQEKLKTRNIRKQGPGLLPPIFKAQIMGFYGVYGARTDNLQDMYNIFPTTRKLFCDIYPEL